MRNTPVPGWLRLLSRGVGFSLLWVILANGDAASWIVGAPVVAFSSLLSLRLWPHPAISLTGLARFMPWFLRQSMAGAIDVAKRAFQPAMPLHPGIVTLRLRLPPGAARVALANVISMLPGTLSADLDADRLTIHALDTRQNLESMLADLEPRVANLFGIELEDRPDTAPVT